MRTSALSSFSFGVVDLAKGPPVLGSLARSTTSTPVLYLDRALVSEHGPDVESIHNHVLQFDSLIDIG